MNRRTSYLVVGAAVAGAAFLLLPGWVAMIVLLLLVGLPVAAWLMLDPAQRRRVIRQHKRGQLGH